MKKITLLLAALCTIALYGMEQAGPVQGAAAELMVALFSSEGKRYEIPLDVAQVSGTINSIITSPKPQQAGAPEETPEVSKVPLTAIPSTILEPIITCMRIIKKELSAAKQAQMPLTYKTIFPQLQQQIPVANRLDMLQAAEYLDIPLLTNAVARSIVPDLRYNDVTKLPRGPITYETINKQLSDNAQIAIAQQYWLESPRFWPEYNRNITRFLNITFTGFSIAELLFYDEIPAIEPDARDHKLQLNLQGLNISSLAGLDQIPNIATLQKLDLSKNQLTIVPNDAFKGLEQLELLNLGLSGITTIQPAAFKGLENSLKDLYLNANPLIIAPADAFKGLAKLQALDIQFTKLSEEDVAKIISVLPETARVWSNYN